MTDPTVDGWTLPDDLHGEVWGAVRPFLTRFASSYSEDEATARAALDVLAVEIADAIAARLTLLAHAIGPPTHDPDAREWAVTCAASDVRSLTQPEANQLARGLESVVEGCGPHRVVHVSELGR